MAVPDIITRVELGWTKHPNVPKANTNLGMSAHYDGSNRGLAKKPHSECIAYWKWCRSFHMNGNGWSDIGYAYFVCPHKYIFEGRGYGYSQAAQAQQGNRLPNGNTRWVTVTFGTGPTETPTPEQLHAWRSLRDWLMSEKGMGKQVRGHRDFSLTSCPGSIIYGMVLDGTLAKSAKNEEDDEMSMPMLREGDDNYDVKTLRSCLYARGFVPLSLVPDEELRAWLDNTKFNPALTTLVRDYQRSEELSMDGIVGPMTWARLLRRS